MRIDTLIVCFMLFALFIVPGITIADENASGICSKCGNEIKAENKKFSVIQKETSKPATFDDIGCAILWRDNQCTAIQMSFDATAKVYDFYSEEEIDVSSAFFVQTSGIASPGGHGITAFKDGSGAEKFMSETGGDKILTYDDLLLLNLQ